MAEEASADGGRNPQVCAIAAHGLCGGSILPFPQQPLDDTAWAEVIRGVASERILGLLFSASASGEFPVTAEQQDQLRALVTDAVRFCLVLEGELLRTATVLSRAGVTMRVLKGPATARLDYPDPTMRLFVDIDILVRSNDFDSAAAALVVAGYVRDDPQPRRGFDRRFSKGTSLVSPHGLSLDLHRTFVKGPFGLKVRLDDLWQGSDPFLVSGRSFDALTVEGRLMHACYHAALGNWPPRLVPHRDVAQIVLSGLCDEARIHELARRWQAEAVVATGVAAAWELLGVAKRTPLAIWAQSFVPQAADRRALDLYANPHRSYAALSMGAVRAIPGVRAKIAFLQALTFPDPSYVSGRHRSRSTRIVQGLRQTLPSARRAKTHAQDQ